MMAPTLLALGVLIANSNFAAGQAAFAPPPPPTPSAVRGLYNPSQPPPGPAVIAPQPAQTSPTTTPTISSGSNLVTPTSAKPIEGGEIVARVDGQIILASDVLWQVNQIIQANRDRIPPHEFDKARQALLRQQVMQLIDTKLLYADFQRNVPVENIPNIEKNLNEPFDSHEVPRLIELLEVEDQLALVNRLEELESSLAIVRRQFNERTIAGEWLRQKSPKPKTATHQQMLDYYQEHLAEYEYPSQAKWEELMIRFSKHNGDRAAAWREMAEIGNQIWQQVSKHPGIRGPIFAEIAKQKSHGFTAADGGLQDWTTKGALRSEAINEALFSLQVGQLSNIIETETGFHIIRVLERKQAGTTPFTEAQADIRKKLEKVDQQELAQEVLRKLRKTSRIWTVFDGDLSGPKYEALRQKGSRR